MIRWPKPISSHAFPADLNGNQEWHYTPDGLPAGVTTYNDAGASSVTNTYSYNHRRLLTQEQQQADGTTLTVGYDYDVNAHLSTLTYPDSLSVAYAPNALGQPTQAGSYATGVTYYPNGAIHQFSYGNGIVHTMTQNARGLPEISQDVDEATGTAIHHDEYDYDAVGNVLGISDGVAGNRGDRDMDYDDLNRLTSATSPMFGTASYTYDGRDNLRHVHVTGGTQIRDQDYVYDDHWRLTNVTAAGVSVIGLGYDAQGNLANKNGTLYTFDYGNRLRAGGPETYRYDVQGRRIRSSSGAGTIYSLYAQSGQLLFQRDERSGQRRQYVYLGGSLVAESDVPLAGGAATVTYQHTDALGTPVAITNSSRTVTERREYEPYGYQTTPALQDGPNYTGHVADAATGLVYMQARYYDPLIGRFVSGDPIMVNPKSGNNFNRYWYANDNPYRFTDPDGRYTCGGGKEFCANVDSYISAMKESAKNLRAGGASKREDFKRVSAALKQIGEKGKGGPNYVPGVVAGRASAQTDQHGTTTVEVAKIADAKLGAQNLAHEATHDIDVGADGLKTTEPQVRETETNAYSASRAVDAGFGKQWTETQFHDAVEASVEFWKQQNEATSDK